MDPEFPQPASPADSDPVAVELARARERLLDLTLRNRLLNFRPTRRTTIPVVDELPWKVWELLRNHT